MLVLVPLGALEPTRRPALAVEGGQVKHGDVDQLPGARRLQEDAPQERVRVCGVGDQEPPAVVVRRDVRQAVDHLLRQARSLVADRQDVASVKTLERVPSLVVRRLAPLHHCHETPRALDLPGVVLADSPLQPLLGLDKALGDALRRDGVDALDFSEDDLRDLVVRGRRGGDIRGSQRVRVHPPARQDRGLEALARTVPRRDRHVAVFHDRLTDLDLLVVEDDP